VTKTLDDMTEPELRDVMNATCRAIKAALPEGTGFIEVVRRPPDPLGILRISVGGGVNDKDGNPVDYVVFRGDPQECVKLLRNAIVALDWATGASATQSS